MHSKCRYLSTIGFKILDFLWISWLAQTAVFAQTLPETLALADSAHKYARYDEARAYYLRVSFFDTLRQHTAHCYRQMADGYMARQKYGSAAKLYDLAYHETPNDSLKSELLFARARCFLFNYQYQEALQELLVIRPKGSAAMLRKQETYLGLTYFALEDHAEAEKYLLQSVADCPVQKEAITAVFADVKHGKYKNPSVARWLSVFLPGAGQLYAGDTKNSLNSLAINGVFIYLFIATGINYNFLGAALTVLPWLQRYYLGGVGKAGLAAEKFNYQRHLKHFNEILKHGAACDTIQMR
jgi:tetratricopeptide (TPR) repeat protein